MRKTLLASVLLLALCGAALAGDMNSPPLTSNPPSTTPASSAQTSDDSAATESPDAADDGTIPGDDTVPLAEIALRVFEGVLALF